ncbi:gamma-glutamyltransferase family protein [Paenarthrobacter sp. NPDC090520]|uniref:gamma-glutamyltransferase family protein n=1 Tax=Paenarthrobacter sp. NPDC090520 TaxID=3364382 RepID=UPI00380028B2
MNQNSLTGAAATPHSGATAAAHRAFAEGGNAVDAALAAAAMLTVVYPNQCTIGGDAIAMVGTPDGNVTVVNGSGRSAHTTDLNKYIGPDGFVPVAGALSVTVPGVLSAWEVLADKWGRQPLAAALLPAAAVAKAGVTVAPGVARDLMREQHLLSQDAGCREVFFQDGVVLKQGETLKLVRLAETLTRLAEDGVNAFYRGPLGESVLETLRGLGSELTRKDLEDHQATLERPASVEFAGTEYLSAAGNSQGTFFLQGLAALDVVAYELGRIPDPDGEDAGVIAGILAAAARDRDQYLGDPSHREVPVDALLSRETAAATAQRALTRSLSGSITGRTYARRTGDTVAVVTADSEGNWVSLIQSAFHAFGSCVLDPGTGILLHNRAASFSLVPGVANELRPGTRPPHTLMPVLVRKDGRLVGAHGTMGGRAQPQVHTHLALNLALGMAPDAASARARWIIGQMEAGAAAVDDAATIAVESGVSDRAVQALHAAGFRSKELEAFDDAAGHLQVVRLTEDAASFAVGSDPRSDGLLADGT